MAEEAGTAGISKPVIGIHDGHNASVAVLAGGKIEFAVQEERLTRVKNQGDAPREAMMAARRSFGAIRSDGHAPEIRAALNGRYMNYGQWRTETILRDYDRSSTLASRAKQPLKNTFFDRLYQRHKAGERLERLSELGIGASFTAVDHHTAHSAAAYYTAPWTGSRTLVLTCDGSGDRLSATVSVGERAHLTRIAEVSENDSIGRLYALVTRHLGMAPLEHEYKVMGLAAYANASREIEKTAGVFESLFEFTADGLEWKRRKGVPAMYAARNLVTRLLEGIRFDTAAAGVQRFLETWLVRWVKHAIAETGIRRIACSGGVFMNVKANLALLELPEVEEMYVFPSCGDESNSIGAACWLAARAGETVKPLGAIYYGDPIRDEKAGHALETAARGGRLRYRLVRDIESQTAEALAQGLIVARAKGAAEFGARALGNRSILARADAPAVVHALNRMVKSRDFWMPFAPSVLAERAEDYYFKKAASSPYMMLAFRSRPERRSAFSAALHPDDFTTRPHEVFAKHNPDYHRLLEEYQARTGEGIVLNTSFNLHGEPIVYSEEDAVDVFLRSGLEYMALGNYWVEKTRARGLTARAGLDT